MGERRMEMGFEMEENVICMGGGPKRRATEKTKSNVQGGVWTMKCFLRYCVWKSLQKYNVLFEEP